MIRRGVSYCLVLVCLVATRSSDAGPESSRDALMLLTSQGHVRPIASADLSRDGRLVLTGGLDESAILWERRSGLELRRFGGFAYPNGEGARQGTAISPDGRRVVYATTNQGAVLRDTATGEQIRTFNGVGDHVLGFSPDGRRIAFGTVDGAVLLWALDKPQPKYLRAHEGGVWALAFADTEQSLFTGAADGTVRQWTRKGKARSVFRGHPQGVSDLGVSADGRVLVSLAKDASIRVWDTDRPKKPRLVLAPRGAADTENRIQDLAVSPDGSRFVTCSTSGQVEVWDANDGTVLGEWKSGAGAIATVAFTPAGDGVLLAGDGLGARIVMVESMATQTTFTPELLQPFGTVVSANGRTIATRNSDLRALIWDATTGQAQRSPRTWRSHCIAISPDGRTVLTGDDDTVARIWMRWTGRVLAEFKGHDSTVRSAAITADGTRAVTGAGDGTLFVWDVSTGKTIAQLVGHTQHVSQLSVSQTGDRLATVSHDKTVRIWDLERGSLLRTIPSEVYQQDVCLSPDGSVVALRVAPEVVAVHDATSGRLLRVIPSGKNRPEDAHTQAITTIEISPDGKQLLTGGWDHSVRMWDLKTGKFQGVLGTHDDDITSLAYLPGGQRALTSATDGTTRLWDLRKKRQLATLVSAMNGGWCAFDADSNFDASAPEQSRLVHWVRGHKAFPLADYKSSYFEPGVLARVLGLAHHAPVRTGRKAPPEPPPVVHSRLVADDKALVLIEAKDDGGGVGPIEVRLNGKQVLDDARGGTVATGGVSSLEVDLTNDPRLLPGEENRIQVDAWNTKLTSKSRGRLIRYVAPGKPRGKPKLWAIVCGVSDYAGTDIDLAFAAKDAINFGFALNLAATEHFGSDRTQVTVLSSPAAPGTIPATKKNLLAAFEAARAAASEDILVVYLAGHGVTSSTGSTGYHYLLAGARAETLGTDAADVALSSDEIMRLVGGIPAVRRQLLILDTCAAGRVRDDARAAGRRTVTQGRTFEKIEDTTGMFILAGCAADKASYESSQVGQGLLTYALLHGLACGCHFTEGVLVDVNRLINYAWEMVPILAAQLQGTGFQQPVKSEGDTSFKIGKLSPEARRKIPLAEIRPMVVRSSFQRLAPPPFDVAGLGSAVDAAMQQASSAAKGKPGVLFVDTSMMSGTYKVAGTYDLSHGTMKGTVYVVRVERTGSETAVGEFTFHGAWTTAANRTALSAKITIQAIDLILGYHGR